MQGVTDALLDLAVVASRDDRRGMRVSIDALRERHLAAAGELSPDGGEHSAAGAIDREFGQLTELVTQIGRGRPPDAAITDAIAARGERMAASLFASALSELGVGAKTKRRFCDVLTGRDPKGGILVTIPSHRGPLTLSFELHNRHTYSEELVKTGKAYSRYTATIGVLTLDNTLISRAIVQNEFRTQADLVDRISGGGGASGLKAVAPTGTEAVSIVIPEEAMQVSILGEKLSVVRPDNTDTFNATGRPMAIISNVLVEYKPPPPPRPARRPAARRPPAKK